MRDWTLAQTRRRGWFKWDLSNLCLADDINVRDFVGWGKTIQSCKGATELFVLHTFCADRNIAFLTRQHLVARPTRTPARLYYAIGNVPLRTQPSDQLKAYQLSIIRYQITYHNCHFLFFNFDYTGRVGRPWHCHFLHTVNSHCQLPSKASAELVRGHPAMHRTPWHIHLWGWLL